MDAVYNIPDAVHSRPSRRALGEWTAERLRQLIFSGELPSGTAVAEEVVTQRLGVSRTPAREALRELELEGLIAVNPVTGRRTVATFDAQDTYATYTIRTALEELAARRAAEYGTDEWIAQLRSIQDQMESTRKERSHKKGGDFEVDFDLHREICAAADMPRLAAVLEPLWAQTHILLRGVYRAGIYGDDAEDAAAFHDHRQLIRAFEIRSPDAAAKAIRDHLHGRRDALVAALESLKP